MRLGRNCAEANKRHLREHLTGLGSHHASAGGQARDTALVQQIRFERLTANVTRWNHAVD